MKARFLMLVVALLLAACGGGTIEETAVSPTTEPAATAAATEAEEAEPATVAPTTAPDPTTAPATETAVPAADETPAAGVEAEPNESISPPVVEEVAIPAGDGLELQATYYGPGGVPPFPGVILLHMLGSNRQVWADNGFAETLTANGYAVLAVDMRGHGDTGGDRDWALAREDMQQVWGSFTERETVAGEQTAVVGASIGANIALTAGADRPAIQTVVLLSPGLDYRGVTTEDQIAAYGERPLLIVASEEDSYAADSSRALADLAAGPAELEMYDGAGHGTNMFNAQPELAQLIIGWLNQHLKQE